MKSINVNEILSALSLALDIAENKTFEHARRTAYIALRIAREMGFPVDQVKDIYAAALLHDIGLVNALADVHSDQGLLVKHCIAGTDIVKALPLSSDVSEFILWHHANWDGSGPFERSGDEIPAGAQIIYLADQMDLRLKELKNIHSERHTVVEFVKSGSGKFFSPAVVDAFLAVQEREIFWLDYNYYNIAEIISKIEPINQTEVDIEGIENIAFTFAKIIDSKSPFTHEHSQGVSFLLSKMSEHYKFDEETTRMLAISGLLHDLGKLAVPNEVIDKPGGLTPFEFQLIKTHPYYTKRILLNIKEFDHITKWAGNHHESLDGEGYPEGLQKNQLSLEERMVTICDVYQALTEKRSYRDALPQSEVYKIMGDLTRKGKLCPETFSELKRTIG